MDNLLLTIAGLLISFSAGFIFSKRRYKSRYKQEESQVLNCVLIAPSAPTLVAYTVATHDSPELARLSNSFCRAGVPLLILGFGCKWQGFGNKILWLKEQFAKQNQDPAHIALFVDAYDVVNLASAAELTAKFQSFKSDLVISGEKGCHPDPDLFGKFEDYSPPFRYPNSGGYIGYCRSVIEMLNSASISPHEDDQRFVTRYVIQNAGKCAVDTNCEVFLPLFDVEESSLEFTPDKSRVLLREKGSLPCILHGNGPSKSLLQKLFPT